MNTNYRLLKTILTPRVLLSFATLFAALAVLVGASFAFLSDTETSQNNSLEAGVLDLKIDNSSYYNGEISEATTWGLDDLEGKLFFDFDDLKPGDWGEDTISIHVIDNDAWACLDSELTSDDDFSSNEPELLTGDLEEDVEDAFDGELGDEVNMLFWVDDGDNVLETDETDDVIAEGVASDVLNEGLTLALADSLTNIFGEEGPLQAEETYYIAKAWCFGTLTENALEQDGLGADSDRTPANSTGGIACDGSELDNSTQTDRVTANITFAIAQSRNYPQFVCGEVPFSCTEEDLIYASSFSDVNQGNRKNGSAIAVDRTDPNDALGAPQTTGAAFDSPVPTGEFFALGFVNGSLVLGFDEPFYNGPGDDLRLYEVTGGTSYPEEDVEVEVSSSSTGPWTSVGTVTRDGGVELGAVSVAQYVRLTEASNIAPFEATADGYDLDAIEAYCTAAEIEES